MTAIETVTPVDEPLTVVGMLQLGKLAIRLHRGQGTTHRQVENMTRGEVLHAYAAAFHDHRPNANGRTARRAVGYHVLRAWYAAMELEEPRGFRVRYDEAAKAARVAEADDTEEMGVRQSIKQYVQDALQMGIAESKITTDGAIQFNVTPGRVKGHVVYWRNKMLADGRLPEDYRLPPGAQRIARRAWSVTCKCGNKITSNDEEVKCRKCKTIVNRP